MSEIEAKGYGRRLRRNLLVGLRPEPRTGSRPFGDYQAYGGKP